MVDVKPVRFDMPEFNIRPKTYRYPYCNTRKVKINFNNGAK